MFARYQADSARGKAKRLLRDYRVYVSEREHKASWIELAEPDHLHLLILF